MSNKKSIKLPKLPVNIDIEHTKILEKKILEFVPHTIKPNDAQVVKVKSLGGLSEKAYVVLNVDGKNIIIKECTSQKE